MYISMDLRRKYDEGTPAVVLAEGEFGQPEGKTANGIVMHGELFDAQAVVDSTCPSPNAGAALDWPAADDVPVVETVTEALNRAPDAAVLVIGVAPAGGDLPAAWVEAIQRAMERGCDVVSGLHVFLSERPAWTERAQQHGVDLVDVRKPPSVADLTLGDGRGSEADADVVLTMGTDCAVGKRTTTFELYRAATDAGLDAGWVATGQTGILVGADRGVVIDRVPADFVSGVVEDMVLDVAADHDIVFVEGQAALTHTAYGGVTLGLLHGAAPDAVVLADDPSREARSHFDDLTVAGVEAERRAITDLADTTVAALSTWGDPEEEAARTGLPAANTYDDDGPETLLTAVLEAL